MKKLITLLVFIMFTSCNQNGKKNSNFSTENSKKPIISKIDSSSLRKKESMKILDEVQSWVVKGIKGELPVERVNKKINPMMDEYFALIKKMKPEDTLVVHNYRMKLIKRLVDLQVKQANK